MAGLPVVPDTDRKLEIALEAYILQGNAGARFKPSVLFSREPVVQAFFECVQLCQRCRPRDLHGQVLECLATPSYIRAVLGRSSLINDTEKDGVPLHT